MKAPRVSRKEKSLNAHGMKYKKPGEKVEVDERQKKAPEAKKGSRSSGWLPEGVEPNGSAIDSQGNSWEVTAEMAKMAPTTKRGAAPSFDFKTKQGSKEQAPKAPKEDSKYDE